MRILSNVHQQFAEYFNNELLKPYIYLLSKRLSEGHICLNLNELQPAELEEVGYGDIGTPVRLIEDPMVSDGSQRTPFILCHNQFYLQRYFQYETTILDQIREFIEADNAQLDQRLTYLRSQKELIKDLFPTHVSNNPTIAAVNWQWVATVSAILHQFTIITGGPGTGKTTTVAKILAVLFAMQPDLKVALCAPTGKAAARMAESLKQVANIGNENLKAKFEALKPSTIHRLLGTIPNSPFFKHTRDNTLDYDVIIVDESSMIDLALLAKLMDAINPTTKLMLLGDKDQLASVEAGSLFGDLCGAQTVLNQFSGSTAASINEFLPEGAQPLSADINLDAPPHLLFEHIIELKKSHRFSDTEGIGKFSKAIIGNDQDLIKEFFNNLDPQVEIDTSYSETIFTEFIAGYADYINETDIAAALKKLNNLRVLCALREGDEGIYQMNERIERYLQNRGLIHKTEEYYLNRPIMVTSNNQELQLFNGDIGIIRMDKELGVLKAWFDMGGGELKSITPGFITQVETVYAMTIHKSQGSEFDKVLVVLPKNEGIQLLTRELLYTAITRAKKKVILQGSDEVILHTAELFIHRGSGIIQRMQE